MANQQGNSSQPQAAGEEMSEILRIRREKLFKMQEEGRDPYLHTRFETDCKAQEILEHFEEYLPKFKKILPHDYRRMMNTIVQMEEKGLSNYVRPQRKLGPAAFTTGGWPRMFARG